MPLCVNAHPLIPETLTSIADLTLALILHVDKTQIVHQVDNVHYVDALEDLQETQTAGLVVLLILVLLTIHVEKVPNVKISAVDRYATVQLDMQEIHMLDVSEVLVYLILSVPTTKHVRTTIVLTHVQLHVVKELIVVHKTM